MGMFDSFYDAGGGEWQTKAYNRLLERWNVGDAIPGPPIDYQAEVVGARRDGSGAGWKYATIRGGVLVSAGDERDASLPVCLYRSGWLGAGEGNG